MQEHYRRLPLRRRGGIGHCSVNLGIFQLRPPSHDKCGGVFTLLPLVQDLKQALHGLQALHKTLAHLLIALPWSNDGKQIPCKWIRFELCCRASIQFSCELS